MDILQKFLGDPLQVAHCNASNWFSTGIVVGRRVLIEGVGGIRKPLLSRTGYTIEVLIGGKSGGKKTLGKYSVQLSLGLTPACGGSNINLYVTPTLLLGNSGILVSRKTCRS